MAKDGKGRDHHNQGKHAKQNDKPVEKDYIAAPFNPSTVGTFYKVGAKAPQMMEVREAATVVSKDSPAPNQDDSSAKTSTPILIVPPTEVKPLQARPVESLVDFSAHIGRVKYTKTAKTSSDILTPAGFHCNVCNATFTSNDLYLQHCNSRVHQRNLGMSMRPEQKSGDEWLERVRAKLAELKAKKRALRNSAKTSGIERLNAAGQRATEIDDARRARKAAKKAARQEANLEDSD